MGVLRSFNAFRKGDPSLGGIEDWLRTRYAVHRTRLVDLGIGPQRMEFLIANEGKALPGDAESAAARSVAFNIGALAEVRRVYREVSRLKGGLPPESGVSADRGAPPVLPGAYDPLIRGVLNGVGTVLGR